MNSRRLLANLGPRLAAAASLLLAASTPLLAECALFSVDVTPVAFGTYNPADSADLASNGELEVTCHDATGEPTSIEIAISSGTSGGYAQRELRLGDAALAYNLYTNAGRSLVWGDGSAPSSTLGITLDGAAGRSVSDSFPVYGEIFAGQQVPSGAYADAVVVTIAF